MTIVGVIQARMNSERLPGKVLADICGRPMLHHVIERVEQSNVDSSVVATSEDSADDPIEALADKLGVRCVRGQEADVLGRFMKVAEESNLQHDDLILRITGDSPLVEPFAINALIHNMKPHLDYVSNVRPKRTYPRGLDAELFWVDTLCRLDRIAVSDQAREHVTWIINEHPTLWNTACGQDIENNSDLRWCVDTETDLKVVRRLCAASLNLPDFRSLVSYARSHPECRENAGVEQKDA